MQTNTTLQIWRVVQPMRRRGGCKSINHLIDLIRKRSLEGMFLSDFLFLPIHRDSAHFALLSKLLNPIKKPLPDRAAAFLK